MGYNDHKAAKVLDEYMGPLETFPAVLIPTACTSHVGVGLGGSLPPPHALSHVSVTWVQCALVTRRIQPWSMLPQVGVIGQRTRVPITRSLGVCMEVARMLAYRWVQSGLPS